MGFSVFTACSFRTNLPMWNSTVSESDWSNVHKTARNHPKFPRKKKKQSEHVLCFQRASDFIQHFEGRRVSVLDQLNNERKVKVEAKHRLGKQNLAFTGKTDERSNWKHKLRMMKFWEHIWKESRTTKRIWEKRLVYFSQNATWIHFFDWWLSWRTCA